MGTNETKLEDENIYLLAKILGVLGHPERLSILCFLKGKGNASIDEMSDSILLAKTSLLEHVEILERIHFIRSIRSGSVINYHLHKEIWKAWKDVLRSLADEL